MTFKSTKGAWRLFPRKKKNWTTEGDDHFPGDVKRIDELGLASCPAPAPARPLSAPRPSPWSRESRSLEPLLPSAVPAEQPLRVGRRQGVNLG